MQTFDIYKTTANGDLQHLGECTEATIVAHKATHKHLIYVARVNAPLGSQSPLKGLTEQEENTAKNLKYGLAIALILSILGFVIEKI